MKKHGLKLNSLKIKTVYKYGAGTNTKSLNNSEATTVTLGTITNILTIGM